MSGGARQAAHGDVAREIHEMITRLVRRAGAISRSSDEAENVTGTVHETAAHRVVSVVSEPIGLHQQHAILKRPRLETCRPARVLPLCDRIGSARYSIMHKGLMRLDRLK